MKKQYDHYIVEEETKPDGSWAGYRVAVVDESGKKQGKLYIKTDGREHYRAAPVDDNSDKELEI